MKHESKPILKVEEPKKGEGFDTKLQSFIKSNLYEDLSDDEKKRLEECKLVFRNYDEQKVGAENGVAIEGTIKDDKVYLSMYPDNSGVVRFRGFIKEKVIDDEAKARLLFERYKRIAQLQSEVGNVTRTVYSGEEKLADERRGEYREMYRDTVVDKFLIGDINELAGKVEIKMEKGFTSSKGNPIIAK